MIIKSLNHPTKWWLIFFQQTTQFLDIHGACDSSDFVTTCIIGASKLCSSRELVPTPKVCRAEASRTCRKPLRTKGGATETSFCGFKPTNGSVNPENEDVNHKKCIEAYTSNVKSTSSMVKPWFHPIASFFLQLFNNNT